MNALFWKQKAIRNLKNWRVACRYIAIILCVNAVTAFALASENTLSPSSIDHLTVEERSWLKAHPEKLTLFFNTEFPPIEFISESGSFTGMGADILSRIEELLSIDFIKTPLDDWNKHLSALKSGECAIAPTIVRTDDREEYAFFTVPYATVPVVIITTRATSEKISLDDLAGKRVGVVSGYATETYLQEMALHDHFDLVPVANVAEGLQRTAFGQIDAFVENLAVAAYYIEIEGIPNLRVAGKTDYTFAWCIGVSREYPLLFSAISKALKDIPTEEMANIRKKWIAMEVDFNMNPKTRRSLIMTALFTVLLVAGLTGITIFLKLRLNQKIAGLKESEEKFRQIYDNIVDVYYETSLEGVILEISPSIERSSQYKREDIIGKSFYTFFTNPVDRDKFIEVIINKGSVRNYEINISDKDGTQHICSMNTELIEDTKGNPTKIIGIFRDITKRKKEEEDKIKAQITTDEREKLALVGKVAGKMAHDFNNVLGIIMGNAELSLLNCQEPKTKKALELIYGQTIRGKNLTRNLIAFAKDQEPKQEFFRINEKIDLVINLMKKDLEGIELLKEEGQGIPKLLADPGMIEHTLVNLIQNSIHALSMVEYPKITIRTYSLESNIYFEIEDNGCGIPEEYLEIIYEPSFTLKGSKDMTDSYKSSIKGTGYGMANIKKYVEQHKGNISVESKFGSGTKVTIGLLVIKKKLTSEEKTKIQLGKAHFEKYILLVEDEMAISDIQYRVLTQKPCSHKVDIANNGQVAIDLFDRNQYDFISLDYILPGGINGMDVYNHIREKNKTIPILFISGNIEFLESIKAMKQRDIYLDHLPKPCKNIHYVNCINKLFTRSL